MIKLKQNQLPEGKESVSSMVRRELENDAFYRKAISLGIANLSAIADSISEKTGCGRDAAKVAVARYAARTREASAQGEAGVAKVLGKSGIALQDDIAVLVVEKNPVTLRNIVSLDFDEVKSIVTGSKTITIACSAPGLSAVEKAFKGHVLKKSSGLFLVQLSSPETIENTPGVFAAVIEAVARRGINVLETSSCYTDTNVIVARPDGLKCFGAIERACGKTRA